MFIWKISYLLYSFFFKKNYILVFSASLLLWQDHMRPGQSNSWFISIQLGRAVQGREANMDAEVGVAHANMPCIFFCILNCFQLLLSLLRP
jgi:hypothetical protein